MASHWVVAENFIEGIAMMLAIVAFLIWAIVTEFWPIILPIVIFAIGFITYCWWNKKAVDPPDYGPGGPR